MTEYDRTFNHPRGLTNSFEIEGENNQKILYVGSITGIYFSGTETVYGDASIQKYVLTPKPDRRRFNFRRFRFETVPGVSKKCAWSFSKTHDLVINRGQTCDDDWSGIRRSIAREATEHRVVLSESLLQLVFGPMEEKLLQIQRAVHRGGLQAVTAIAS